jgi:6-phosphogluconolactonase
MAAYKLLAEQYRDSVDWSKVTVVLGDERCVPLNHPDSNWFQIASAFLGTIPLSDSNKLRPPYELPAGQAAEQYGSLLESLPHNDQLIPRFDLVWLGIGEDGHTLSLFPGHPALTVTTSLVIPVHDSPKPPPDRLSLTFYALANTTHCFIMASGPAKSEIIAQAMADNSALPIVQAINVVEANGGTVRWLLDTSAASQMNSV